MFGYSTTLRSMSQGRATYTMEFKHYAEAPRNVSEAIMAARAKVIFEAVCDGVPPCSRAGRISNIVQT